MNNCYHTDETKRMFRKYVTATTSISNFVRQAINAYAQDQGYNFQPLDIDSKKLAEIKELEQSKKTVNYDYLYAFEYIKSKFPMAFISNLVRAAIINYPRLHP